MAGTRDSGSPRARATVKLGIAFVATGFGFGLTAALVCGLGLLGLVAGAAAWVELSTLGGRLERERGPRRLDERDLYPLRLQLRGGLLPLPGGELSDPLLERSVPVGPRWRRRLSRDVRLDGPGRRSLTPSHLTVCDPLGLWRRELRSTRSDEVVVLPRVEPVQSAVGGSEGGGRSEGDGSSGDARSAKGGLAQFEVDGLRPYRDGSPASRIHWPAVARTGEMLERQLIAGGDARPVVVFEPRGGEPRDVQSAMRATASLCVTLARAGGCDLMLPGARRPLTIDAALRSWPEAHTRIAMTDPEGRVGAPASLRGAVVLWVTAAPSPPASIRRLRAGSPLVTPHPSGRSAAFQVSGCFAYPVAVSERRAATRRVAA
jgi:uncharacterized protein (DUF58 family)